MPPSTVCEPPIKSIPQGVEGQLPSPADSEEEEEAEELFITVSAIFLLVRSLQAQDEKAGTEAAGMKTPLDSRYGQFRSFWLAVPPPRTPSSPPSLGN